MKEPAFSVCIPNYNYGRFIGDTIESVLRQTYQRFEIIVVDNASTDNSVEVVQSFKDQRIRLFRNRQNVGFAPNLHRATQHARNDFINLLSSDDQMMPTALEEYAKVITNLGDDARRAVLLSDAEGFDNSGNVLRQIRKARHTFERVSLPADTAPPVKTVTTRYRGLDVLRDALSRLDTMGVFCSITYHRSLWESVEGYNAVRTIGPDKHFNYKLLALDPVVAYVHAPLFRYRDYVSLNRAAVQETMKFPIDEYLNVLEFGDERLLGMLGLTRTGLIRAMLEHACLRESLVQLGLGNYAFAFKLFAFALATFPGQALRMRKTYMILPLLATGPLSRLIAPPLRALYRRFQAPTEPFSALADENSK